MHLFTSNESVRRKWTKFVQKHRRGFKPSKTSVLCSVHFTPESFSRRIDPADQPSVLRIEKGAFPTIDVAITQGDVPAVTDRERRKISLI